MSKITKVPISDLRLRKIVVSGYTDDFFTKDHTSKACFNNVICVAELYDKLGYVVHQDKSVLILTQKTTILRLEINSRYISVKLTPRKDLKRLLHQLFSTRNPSIRFLAKVIGRTVSVFPAVKYVHLYYWALENHKIRPLEICKGGLDSHNPISDDTKYHLKWWRDNKPNGKLDPPTNYRYWVFLWCIRFCKERSFEIKPTGGAWSETKKGYHINEKELLAIFYSLKSFKFNLQVKHVKRFSDNTTAVAVINKMGTCFPYLSHITASHIPGKENFEADFESRRE